VSSPISLPALYLISAELEQDYLFSETLCGFLLQ
jgi:hypothetical protein